MIVFSFWESSPYCRCLNLSMHMVIVRLHEAIRRQIKVAHVGQDEERSALRLVE